VEYALCTMQRVKGDSGVEPSGRVPNETEHKVLPRTRNSLFAIKCLGGRIPQTKGPHGECQLGVHRKPINMCNTYIYSKHSTHRQQQGHEIENGNQQYTILSAQNVT
jgi:hypothetical protein